LAKRIFKDANETKLGLDSKCINK